MAWQLRDSFYAAQWWYLRVELVILKAMFFLAKLIGTTAKVFT